MSGEIILTSGALIAFLAAAYFGAALCLPKAERKSNDRAR